jgi:hypothetical protein
MLTQAQETPTQLDALRPVKISSELESSKLDVRIDTLNRLAMALDASMAELFDETRRAEPNSPIGYLLFTSSCFSSDA